MIEPFATAAGAAFYNRYKSRRQIWLVDLLWMRQPPPRARKETARNAAASACPPYAIQNQIFSSMFRGTCSGQISASSAALPVQISASAALTKLVRLNTFQKRKRPK